MNFPDQVNMALCLVNQADGLVTGDYSRMIAARRQAESHARGEALGFEPSQIEDNPALAKKLRQPMFGEDGKFINRRRQAGGGIDASYWRPKMDRPAGAA